MKLITRLAYQILPVTTLSTLRQELWLTRRRWYSYISLAQYQRRQIVKRTKNLKIHLGCGERFVNGWVNVDIIDHNRVDIQWDLRNKLPFSNESADLIYSEHTLEHLEKEQALQLINECYRVLVPGGMIRLGVPDAELYMDAYIRKDEVFFKGLERLGGATIPLETPIDVINQMFRMGGHHRFAWDAHTLMLALERAGFHTIQQSTSGSSVHAQLCLDDPARAFETLYIEAYK